MYTIYIGEVNNNNAEQIDNWQPLHHPNLTQQGLVCISPTISEQVNSISELQFSIAATNPLFRSLHQRKTFVSVRNGQTEVWRGRVIEISQAMNTVKKVVCENELAYLLDTVVEPFSFSGTLERLFRIIVNKHNSILSGTSVRRFTAGTITAGIIDGEEQQIEMTENTANVTWKLIQSLIKKFGGYVRTRKEGDTVYLDYLNDFPLAEACNQTVAYGKNLLDFSETIDASQIVTMLMPFGATKKAPPVLYKRVGTQGEAGRTFKRVTGDIDAGQYLLVANGAAMIVWPRTIGSKEGLGFHLLNPDRATFFTDSNGVETILLTSEYCYGTQYSELGKASESVWTLAVTTIPGKNLNATTKTTMRMTESGTSNEIQEDVYGNVSAFIQVAGDTVQMSGSRSISTTGTVATNSDDAWRFSINPDGNTDYILTGGGVTGGLLVDTVAPSAKNKCWQISNNENGATIKSVWNDENGADAVIHGDIDSHFYCAQNASGNDEKFNDRVTVKCIDQTYAGNRGVVTHNDAVTAWGFILGTRVFEEINTPFDLEKAALDWLDKQYVQTLSGLNVSAVDLSAIDSDVDELAVGRYCHIYSKPHELSMTLLCNKRTLDLMNPTKTKISFGVGKQTITELQGRLLADVR